MDKEIKLKDFQSSSSDRGSSAVQIARLTQRIKELSKHFKKHKKDFHSRMGLIHIINQRKSLLSYLKRKDNDRYQFVINQLGLRK